MRVIVYGSLRRKQGNCRWMTHAIWLGYHVLSGYELYRLGHDPAVIVGDGQVYCEVYRITASILAELDDLRSSTNNYKRHLVPTPYGAAWLYLYQYPVDSANRIISGDWLKQNQLEIPKTMASGV